MVILGSDLHCTKIDLRKGDDFYRVLSFGKEDGTLLDLAGLAFRWDFFDSGEPIFSLYGADMPTEDNQLILHIPSTIFESFPIMGSYTHRLHETTQNKTIFEGPVEFIPGSATSASPGYIYYGPTIASATTSDAIKSLDYAAFSSYTTLTLPTGNVRTKFIIALPDGIEIDTITDQDALNIQITDDYELQGQVAVSVGSNTIQYNVYEMNIAIPYSASHNHLITVSNE